MAPEHRQRDVAAVGLVHRAVVAKAAKTSAHRKARGEPEPAAHAVHHRRAGEVHEAHLAKPPALIEQAPGPHPVPEDRIHHRHRQRHQQVAGELDPLGHGARHDGYRRAAERELVEEECGGPPAVARVEVRSEERSAQPAVPRGPEHQPEADGPEDQCRDAEVGHVLDGDVDRVFGAGHPRLEAEEPRLHEEDQPGGRDEPQHVEQSRVHEPSFTGVRAGPRSALPGPAESPPGPAPIGGCRGPLETGLSIFPVGVTQNDVDHDRVVP